MALAVLLFAVCVLHLSETQGSSDVTIVFVQKGKNLHLDVKKPVVLGKRDEFKWTVNKTQNVVRLFHDNDTSINRRYVGRAEVSLQNHSLLLKNVQQNDSGDYTALIAADDNQHLAEYKVIIQDPVSPVQLSVDPVSNSTESCNLTVSCSTKDHHIISNFRCDDQTCHQNGRDQPEVTTSGSFLHVYLLNDSINCNHSNQVSWKKHMKGIRDFCSQTAALNLAQTIAIGSGILVFLCLLICGLIIYKRKKNCENTVYDIPQDINLGQRPNQNDTEDASGLSPNSTYALVGLPIRPTGSTETKKNPQPETIYAQVNKAPKSDHHPEQESGDNMHSQNLITVCQDRF